MSWYQENWTGVLFVLIMVVILFRGPVLMWLFKVRTITVHELAAMLSSANPPVLLDVRSPAEFESGHLPGALLLPLQELTRKRAIEIKERFPEREVAVICRSGSRSSLAAVDFRRVGVARVFNVMGGITAWRNQGYPVRK